MTMKKLIETIDRLNEEFLPPNHPDWDLTPAERIKKQNERIAADSAADAEVWHKGLKPAEKVKEDGPVKDYAEWKKQILAKHPTAKFRRDPNGTDAMVDGKSVGQWDKFGGDQIEESSESIYLGAKVYMAGYEEGEPMEVVKIIDDHLVLIVDDYGQKLKVMISDLVPADGITESKPQSMKSALNNALSKAEPGSKLDKKIKHHNSQVKQFGKGVLDKAPEGYHLDKKGMIRLGEGKSENRAQWDRINSRGTVPSIDRERYTDLSGEGLEGPFRMKNGKVLYYDPRQGQYYDRDTDMFVDYDDYAAMNEGEELTELSRGKLNDYLSKASDNSQKDDLDPTKRTAEKRNRTVGGVKNAFNKLHLQGMVKVPATESAESTSEADKVLKIIEKAKKILAMLNDESVSVEEKARLRDKVAGLNDVFEGLRGKISALNEVSPVQPVQPVQPTQTPTPTPTPGQQAANTGNDQTQQQPDQNNPQNAKVLPPAEQMKGFLQTLKAPGAIDQALRNLKV